jgi:hypothetical protein
MPPLILRAFAAAFASWLDGRRSAEWMVRPGRAVLLPEMLTTVGKSRQLTGLTAKGSSGLALTGFCV